MKKVIRKGAIIAASSILILIVLMNVSVYGYISLDSYDYISALDYKAYLNTYDNAKIINQKINVDIKDIYKTDNATITEGYNGYEGYLIIINDMGSGEWTIDAPETGFYNISLGYCQLPGRGNDMNLAVYINNEIPFREAGNITLRRYWRDDFDGSFFETDYWGNDLRPSQVENPMWVTFDINDYSSYVADPLKIYLEKGSNNIRIESVSEPIAIKSITLYEVEKPRSYTQIKAEYDQYGYKKTSGVQEKFQAENTLRVNDRVLSPMNDRTSPATQPNKGGLISLNYIGGYNWRHPGQAISWEIYAPESGLYNLNFKYKQNFNRDTFSVRRLLINGVVPFEEASNLEFEYTSKWKNYIPGNKDGGFLFYFEKGYHTLTLEAILGDLNTVISDVEAALRELNKAYREILMITGVSPDQFRDYFLERQIPQTIESLKKQAEVINSASNKLYEVTGNKGSNVALLDKISRQLIDLAERPHTIPERFAAFKDNLGALGTWLLVIKEQPLNIDYIVLNSVDEEIPRAEAGFFGRVWHEIASFFNSFIMNYQQLSDTSNNMKKITVWIPTGRDQAQVLKSMIDDSFTPNFNIGVDIQLVQNTVLLPATVAGRGPDVFLQANIQEPINFALRGAVENLTAYEDFNKVIQRFHESALVPLSLEGSTYALPETQTFPMLFYRIDILRELGMQIPETWDEVYECISILQKNNMTFATPTSTTIAPGLGLSTYYMFLLQNGGRVFHEDGMASALDDEVAVQAYQEWVGLYNKYKLPLTYDSANRFRLGEAPILIADYPLFNMLEVFAPEIRGLWSFAPVPGTVKADGFIDHSIPSGGTAAMMIAASEQKDAAWEFLKWWTSADTQHTFGIEMEALMGAAARHPTANIEALSKLPWSVKEYRMLESQRVHVKGIPQIPGSYFIPRHMDNAFRAVVLAGNEPRGTLLDYVDIINREITAKRKELGFKTREVEGVDGR